jgi:hypothetical protein
LTALISSYSASLTGDRWGPYVSERQWGTVREDYSRRRQRLELPAARARAQRAYRWGEDGIAGISDDQQRLCFALALWNGATRCSRSACSG